MGGKTSTSTQQVSIPPEVLARYNAVNARAEQVAQQPFQQYSGQFVAPLTGTQQAGIQGATAGANLAQPFFGAGAGMTMAGAQDVGALTPGQIAYYENPYIESVARPTYQALRQQQQEEMAGQTAQAIRAGAFGGDRAGLVAANLARQQQLGTAQAMAPIYAQGYGQAVQTAAGQQGVVAADLARRMQAGQQLAGLGAGAQQAALQGAQAQLAAGTAEQQTQQADLTARYNQFLQERGYPFQVAQFLANIAMGTGALAGSTTTTQQPLPFFSDRRLKRNIEEIGKLKDGQKLYRYQMADGQTHIGLMADEVEKHHPDAVGVAGGYKTVDYRAATDDAARHKKAYGGGLMPSSEGGAVMPMMAGEGFARGGSPLDAEDFAAIMASQRQSLGPFAKSGLYGSGSSQMPAISSYVPQASLPVPKLITAGGLPQQQPGGLSQAVQTGSNIANLAKMGLEAKRELEKEPVGGKERRLAPPAPETPRVPSRANIEETSPSGVVGRAYGGAADTPFAADTPYDDIKNMDYFPREVFSSPKLSLARAPGIAPSSQKSGFDLGDFAKIAATAASFMSSGGIAGRRGYQEGGNPRLDQLLSETGITPLRETQIDGGSRPMTPTERREYYSRLKQHESPTGITNPQSGAATEFQFLPSTYRDIRSRSGLNLPENMSDLTEEQKYAAADFLTNENARILQRNLGRYPTPAESMFAHHFGGAGASRLLQMPQETKFEDLGSDFWQRNFRAPYTNERLVSTNRLQGRTIGDVVNEYNRLMSGVIQNLANNQGQGTQPPAGTVASASLPSPPAETRAEGVAGNLPPVPERGLGAAEIAQGTSGAEEQLRERDLGPFERISSGVLPKSVPREAQFWIPLLSGVGSMLASQSKTLPGAIGEGLVGGVSGYLGAQKGLQEVAESKAREEAQYAGLANEAVRVDRNGRTTIRTYDPRRGAYIFMPIDDFYNEMDKGNAPIIDPRDRRQIESLGIRLPPQSAQAPSGGEAQRPLYQNPSQDILINAEREARNVRTSGIPNIPQHAISQFSPFAEQSAIANTFMGNKNELISFSQSFTELPESGLAASGNPEIFRSFARGFAALARAAGLPGEGFASASNLAEIENIYKSATRQAVQAASEAQQRSRQALQDIASIFPSAGNTKEGAAKLFSMLYVAGQKEIDKDRFYREVQNHVNNRFPGQPELAQYVGRGLSDAYDSRMIRQYDKEKKAIENMFKSKIKEDSPNFNVSPANFLLKNYDKIMRDPRWREYYSKNFGPEIFRYFSGEM